MKNTDTLLTSVGEVSIQYLRKKSTLKSIKITESKDAYNLFLKIYPTGSIEHREIMYAIFLNRNNIVLGYACISVGGVSSTFCDPKIVFQLALKLNACGFILAHNHPSGNLKPSDSDIKLTRRIKEGAAIMDFILLDHLIICENGYYSIIDEG